MVFVIKQVLKTQNTLRIEVLEFNWVLIREFLAFYHFSQYTRVGLAKRNAYFQ